MAGQHAIVTPVTAGAANVVASAAKVRRYLMIQNQSTTATVYVAFDRAAVAAPTAGQISLAPISTTWSGVIEWRGGESYMVPGNQINVIASAASTPVTIIE